MSTSKNIEPGLIMYHYSLNHGEGWEDYYSYEPDDAAAREKARRLLTITSSKEVYIYRHHNHDTCGVKHYLDKVAACDTRQ